MRSLRSRLTIRRAARRPAWPWLTLAGGALAALTLGAAVSRAEPNPGWRAGQVAEIGQALAATERATISAGASGLARRLGLPGAAAPATRVLDRTLGRFIDTVELRDADGRLAALVTRDAMSGQLRSAVRLAWSGDLEVPRVDADQAPSVARGFVAAAGVAVPAARPTTAWDDGMSAWRVRWPRVVDGILVPSDGVVAWVHRGGQLKALSDIETPLAAAPATRIQPAVALATVGGYLQRNGIAAMRGLMLEEPSLRWAEANDFVDPSLPDAPAPALRLAWLVRFSYLPPGWTERHFVELAVDAGTGALIGGTESA